MPVKVQSKKKMKINEEKMSKLENSKKTAAASRAPVIAAARWTHLCVLCSMAILFYDTNIICVGVGQFGSKQDTD